MSRPDTQAPTKGRGHLSSDRRAFLGGLWAFAASGLVACSGIEGQQSAEIRFDLGKDILETGRASGVPMTTEILIAESTTE